jgi:hypothetical protein
MFEIDFTKHKPKKRQNNVYLCNIRKRLISVTPEEEVRQSLISFLITEKGYPIENIQIEVPMSYFEKGAKGRADILIFDNDENVLCLIECKEPREYLTDNVLEQVERYDKYVKAETTCVVIGSEIHFFAFMQNENTIIKLSEFPTFKTLIENGQVDYFMPEIEEFEKINFIEPLDQDIINEFYDEGIFGENTDEKYLPFLVNLYNFYQDKENKVLGIDNVEDIGIKVTKYGNASGGGFFGNYRAFLDYNSNSVVSFAISSMTRGENYPVHTSLMFAVDMKGKFHLSLEMRVDKHINFNENKILITHDGTITIGKLGAAKRKDLINFIEERKPELIKDGKVYLGMFEVDKEIKSTDSETKEFLKNCIEYSLIRDEFRENKKAIS